MLQNLERTLKQAIKQIPAVRASSARAYRSIGIYVRAWLPFFRRHDRFVFLGVLVAFIAWIGLFSQARPPAAPPLSLVHVAEVHRQNSQETIAFLGTLVSRYSGVIASRIAGPVESMP